MAGTRSTSFCSAVEVAPGRDAEDADVALVGGDPVLERAGVLAVALDGAVDGADGLAEAGAVDHRVVPGHGARAVGVHPEPQAGLPGDGRVLRDEPRLVEQVGADRVADGLVVV